MEFWRQLLFKHSTFKHSSNNKKTNREDNKNTRFTSRDNNMVNLSRVGRSTYFLGNDARLVIIAIVESVSSSNCRPQRWKKRTSGVCNRRVNSLRAIRYGNNTGNLSPKLFPERIDDLFHEARSGHFAIVSPLPARYRRIATIERFPAIVQLEFYGLPYEWYNSLEFNAESHSWTVDCSRSNRSFRVLGHTKLLVLLAPSLSSAYCRTVARHVYMEKYKKYSKVFALR